MDSVAAAVMTLLSCSQGETSICKPIDMAPTMFASLDQCQASLADRLASAPNGEMVGRCRVVDATATGSLPAGYRTVVVTRGIDHQATTYIVLHKE